MIITAGTTSNSIDVQIVNDSGIAVPSLTYADFNTQFGSLVYSLGTNTSDGSTAYVTLAALTTPYSSAGVKERAGGWYRVDIPDAMVATAGTKPRIIGEATGYHLLHEPIQVNPAVAFPVNAAQVNGVAPGAKGGVPITDATTGLGLTGYGGGAVTVGKSEVTLNAIDVTGNLPAMVKGLVTTVLTETGVGYLAGSFKAMLDTGTAPSSTWATFTNAIPDNWITNSGLDSSAIASIQSGLSTYAGGDTAGTTTLLSRVTATRAGYFDYLASGPVATQTQVSGLMLGGPAFVVDSDIIVPIAGTLQYEVLLYVYSDVGGTLIDADSTPTITVKSASGTSYSARLGSVTHVSTGKYKVAYTSTYSDNVFESLVWEASYSVNSVATAIPQQSFTTDMLNDFFNSTDRSKLVAMYNVIPAHTPLIDSSGRTTDINSLAIKAKTDIIGTNAADSANAITAQSTISTNLNATISSRSTYTGGAADANAVAIKASTDALATSWTIVDGKAVFTGLAMANVGGSLTTDQANQLNIIYTRSQTVGNGQVYLLTPLSPNGVSLTIVPGDTYGGMSGNPRIIWNSMTWSDLTSSTISVKFVANTSSAVAALTAAGVLITSTPTGTQSVGLDLTSAQTLMLTKGMFYTFYVVATWSDGSTYTIASGNVTVL